jgi:molybdopterin-guanine dinucleotide biosynthesis adapter protein
LLVVSVVGPQEAGKTTLIARMCAEWRKRGIHVGVLKHDGHADARGSDDWEKPDSDTARCAEAGAVATMVAGGGRTLLRLTRDADADNVEALCRRMADAAASSGTPLDVIVVEGYKASRLRKLVPVRRPSDVAWLKRQDVQNLYAVVSSPEVAHLVGDQWRVYDEDDVAQLCYDLWR